MAAALRLHSYNTPEDSKERAWLTYPPDQPLRLAIHTPRAPPGDGVMGGQLPCSYGQHGRISFALRRGQL